MKKTNVFTWEGLQRNDKNLTQMDKGIVKRPGNKQQLACNVLKDVSNTRIIRDQRQVSASPYQSNFKNSLQKLGIKSLVWFIIYPT